MKLRIGIVGLFTFLMSLLSFAQEVEGSVDESTLSVETGVVVKEDVETALSENEHASRKADLENTTALPVNANKKKRIKIKDIFKAVKRAKSMRRGADEMTILLVILALFIPPLAVGIFEGITTRFWIDLILFLLGIGVGLWLLGSGIGWICGIVAVIYAILIILGVI